MSSPDPDLGFLRDARLAAHIASNVPLWVWRPDGSEIVFANAAGAALFGARTPRDLAGRRFDAAESGRQIARIAGSLPLSGTTRLEKLRGFGTPLGRLLVCGCSRLNFGDRSLVVVCPAEPAGPALTFAERVGRLIDGLESPAAAYATDGTLIAANAAAEPFLGAATSLDAIGAESLAGETLRDGKATADISRARIAAERIGASPNTFLLATLQAVEPPLNVDIQTIAQAMERAAVAPAPAERPDEAPIPAPPDRRQPLRFVWHMNAEGRFSLGSEELTEVIGRSVTTALGRPWSEIAAELDLDPEGQVARAVASRETWSGITVSWPVEDSSDRLSIELSGLPDFDHERRFRGYRGFGVCRDVARIASLMSERRARMLAPQEAAPPSEAVPEAEATEPTETASPERLGDNVLRFPTSAPAEPATALTPIEQEAFQDLAQQLSDRLRGDHPGQSPIANFVPEMPDIVPTPPDMLAEQPFAEAPAEAAATSETFFGYSEQAASEQPASPEDAATNILSFAAPAGPASPEFVVLDVPASDPVPQDDAVPINSAGAAEQPSTPFDDGPPPIVEAPIIASAEADLPPETMPALAGDVATAAARSDDALPEPVPHATGFVPADPVPEARSGETERAAPMPVFSRQPNREAAGAVPEGERPILDRLPVGVLIYRLDELLFANRPFLEWTGYPDLESFAEAGGLENILLDDNAAPAATGAMQNARMLAVMTADGSELPMQGQLFDIPWEGQSALALIFASADDAKAREAARAAEAAQAEEAANAIAAVKAAEAALQSVRSERQELETILDTAADGVAIFDRDGRILLANGSAERLFGTDQSALRGRIVFDLLLPEYRAEARAYLDGLVQDVFASERPEGLEVAAEVPRRGILALFVTMGRIASEQKFCAVFRDITQWKRNEEELIAARRLAEKASTAKSEFLAKISHEIRTPLNAIIGFSEVMMDERFGPVGNERYREYLKDIHASGGHLVSLLNDLLDLSKIEAGKLDLDFAGFDLNQLTQQCVALMQPQANRERIIIRTSLPPSLPPVFADARSVRQIVLNLLSNSIKFTGAGGQIIVSTAADEHGEVTLRVRDTGIGMSEKEIQIALEPFRQLATSVRAGVAGTGLGLPLTKALAEANRAHFKIRSAVNDGTLVEVAFPLARVAAE